MASAEGLAEILALARRAHALLGEIGAGPITREWLIENNPVLADFDEKSPGLLELLVAATKGDQESLRRLEAMTRAQEGPRTVQ